LSPGFVPNPWNWTTAFLIINVSPLNGAVDVPLYEPIIMTISGIDITTLPVPFWSLSPDPGGWIINWIPPNTFLLFHNPLEPCMMYWFSPVIPGFFFIDDTWTTICPPIITAYEPGGTARMMAHISGTLQVCLAQIRIG